MMKMKIAAAVLSVLVSSAAVAETVTLSGDEIRETVAGYTIEGSMTDTGRYSEFYADDGEIRGDGYTGAWTVENDAMCFAYGDAPADCWSVAFQESEVLWVKDGEILGSGARLEGNPNNY